MGRTVVVQGLGFVGLAMATVLANAKDKKGNAVFQVIGVDLPGRDEFYQKINQGILPFKTEDESFPVELKKAVLELKNFVATDKISSYQKADIVVCDVHLSIEKKDDANYKNYELKDTPFKKAIQILGENVAPECLVVIETTVPPGFTRHVVYPILKKCFEERGIKTEPILAHSYERVMPGKEYLASIRSYFRTFSGLSVDASARVRDFFNLFIDIENYPLREEKTPEATELAKVLENSYRAMNIAFIYEWTLLAEQLGVNLFSVITGIRNRTTHNNMMKPGFGVGGYCLTKDSLLAQWTVDNLCQGGVDLAFSLEALKTNDKMPLHVVNLISKKKNFSKLKIAVLGVSYREDVGDTRFSPTEVFVRKCEESGSELMVHDPYVEVWDELPKIKWIESLDQLQNFDVVVLTTRHSCYLQRTQEQWKNSLKPSALVVDAFDILNDEKIKYLFKNKIEVIGVGKGHISSMEQK